MNPKVSVIIPAYGRTDFLSDAIESVFSQTLDDYELVIVDDNDPSSDYRAETTKIIERHRVVGREIIYIKHDCNRNGAAARNTGIRNSSGEFISFLDSDDCYFPTRLEQAVTTLEREPEHVGGVYTGVEFRRRGKVFNAYQNMPAGNFLAETLACKFKLGTGSNLFLRRKVVERLEGFDESFWRHQDYEFMVRFFETYDITSIGSKLVIKNNENFNLPNFRKLLQIKIQYLQKYKKHIEALPKHERSFVLCSNYISLGELALMEGLRCESSEMYAIARQHGDLGLKNRIRRTILWLQSFLK